MSSPARWDWRAEAEAVGVAADGSFNAGAAGFTAPTALIWRDQDGRRHDISGAELTRQASRIAAALHHLGVRAGDRVAGLMSRRPESFTAALATWRLGAVYVPLFSGFGGEGLRVRLADSAPSVVVTDSASRSALHGLDGPAAAGRILVVDEPGDSGAASLLDLESRDLADPGVARTHLDDTATIMYTSGTTGAPKGCMIPHRAVVSLRPFVRHCLAVGAGDVLFSGADPGWSFGLYTTGMAPMSVGATRVMSQGPFSPGEWWSTLRETGASHLAAAPTGFRQLAGAGQGLVPPVFRAATSAGEPLDAPTYDWYQEHCGVTVHDSYGLSEVGMAVANLRGALANEPAPGCMGVPVPGFDVRLWDASGSEVAGEGEGRIAIADNGFFLSNGYWNRETEWAARWNDGWYLTEDLARRDELGRFWYVARADDIIVTAGYNVSPAEVEAVLIAHPGIRDAACTGIADSRKGRVVAAFVILEGPGAPDLEQDLRAWVGARLGWHAAPRMVRAVDTLPRTDSGKLQRHLLQSSDR